MKSFLNRPSLFLSSFLWLFLFFTIWVVSTLFLNYPAIYGVAACSGIFIISLTSFIDIYNFYSSFQTPVHVIVYIGGKLSIVSWICLNTLPCSGFVKKSSSVLVKGQNTCPHIYLSCLLRKDTWCWADMFVFLIISDVGIYIPCSGKNCLFHRFLAIV